MTVSERPLAGTDRLARFLSAIPTRRRSPSAWHGRLAGSARIRWTRIAKHAKAADNSAPTRKPSRVRARERSSRHRTPQAMRALTAIGVLTDPPKPCRSCMRVQTIPTNATDPATIENAEAASSKGPMRILRPGSPPPSSPEWKRSRRAEDRPPVHAPPQRTWPVPERRHQGRQRYIRRRRPPARGHATRASGWSWEARSPQARSSGARTWRSLREEGPDTEASNGHDDRQADRHRSGQHVDESQLANTELPGELGLDTRVGAVSRTTNASPAKPW
jgi:hypothetical protein